MEKKRLPLTPVKDLNHSVIPDQITPSGKVLRAKVARGVKRCIAAPSLDVDKENNSEDEYGPEVLTASPQSLTRVLYMKAMNRVKAECIKLGVTDEKIQPRLEQARCAIGAQALLRQLFATKPTQQEEKDFKKLAQFFNVPEYHLRYDASVPNAVSEGNIVVANKAEMDKLTPLQRAAVYAHEIAHSKHEDGIYRTAYLDEFVAQGKFVEFLLHISGILYRTQETFADLVPAARAPNLARGIMEFRQDFALKNGPGLPSTHPANDVWAELDASMVDLHAKHKEEKDRKERCSHMNKRLKGLLEEESATSEPKK